MELLTGRCLQDFEKWYLQQEYGERIVNDISYAINEFYGCSFYNMPLSFQYGVLVGFFDSVDIFIVNALVNGGHRRYLIYNKEVKNLVKVHINDIFMTKEKTIQKANELYNKQHG